MPSPFPAPLCLFSYSEQVLRVERLIASGAFNAQALAPELLLQFHQEIAGALVPEWAGRWRDGEVKFAPNNTVWHKARERIKKSGVDVSLSLLKGILNQLLKQSLNLP